MKNKRIYLFVIQIFLAFGVAVYAYLGNFTRMLADDFCSATRVNSLGLLQFIWFWYKFWGGRYSAYALDWVTLKILGAYNLHYFVPGMLVILAASLMFLFYLYLKDKGSETLLHSFALSAGFLFAFLLISPNLEQSLFWWNGARAYSAPMMFLALFSFVLYYAVSQLKINFKWIYALSFLVFFVIAGMGEIYAVGQAGFLGFLMLLIFINKESDSSPRLGTIVSGLAGTFLALLVIFVAPGNSARQALLPLPPPNLFNLLEISLQAYLKFIQDIFISPVKSAGLLGVIFLYVWVGWFHKDRASSNISVIFLSIAWGIALSFACFLPGVYGFSEPPPARVLTVPAFFLIIFILYAAYLIGGRLSNALSHSVAGENVIFALAFILVIISTAINSVDVLKHRQQYISFAQKWDQVDRLILDAKAKGEGAVSVPAMVNWAYLAAPTDNPRFWATYCYSSYYKIHVNGPPSNEIVKYYQQNPP